MSTIWRTFELPVLFKFYLHTYNYLRLLVASFQKLSREHGGVLQLLVSHVAQNVLVQAHRQLVPLFDRVALVFAQRQRRWCCRGRVVRVGLRRKLKVLRGEGGGNLLLVVHPHLGRQLGVQRYPKAPARPVVVGAARPFERSEREVPAVGFEETRLHVWTALQRDAWRQKKRVRRAEENMFKNRWRSHEVDIDHESVKNRTFI